MDQQRLKSMGLELMATSEAVYLSALENDGYPRIRAMLNLRNRTHYPDHVYLYDEHDEDFMVYLSTNTSSRKRKDLEANPRIGLYYCHPTQFLGMSLVGDVEVVEDPAIKAAVWAEGWERYYRTTGKPDDPDYTLLRLFPINAQGWTGSQPFELRFNR